MFFKGIILINQVGTLAILKLLLCVSCRYTALRLDMRKASVVARHRSGPRQTCGGSRCRRMLCTQTDGGGTESRFEDRRPVLPGNRPNRAVRAITVLVAGGIISRRSRGRRVSEVSPTGSSRRSRYETTGRGCDHRRTRGSKYREPESISVVFLKASEFLFSLNLPNSA